MKSLLTGTALLWALCCSAAAHELASNRATLVLRDGQHLTLTLFVDYPVVLHRLIAPQRSFQEFALIAAAMTPQEFASQLSEAQRKLQAATMLVGRSRTAGAFTQWSWPAAQAVQQLLQQRAMQAVVSPREHSHVAQSEIKAETTASDPAELASVSLRLPAELDQVLVVSYQPKQVWIKPGKPSSVIKF